MWVFDDSLCYPGAVMTWLRVISSPLLALALALASGCQNNTVLLEFETDNSDDDGATTGDETGAAPTTTSSTTSPPPDMGVSSGRSFLLAMSTPLDPSLPFQAIVTIDESPGQVDMSLQWLSLSLGSRTAPRQPVGEVYYYSIPIDQSGFIYWDLGTVDIPAAANPITAADVTATVLAGATPVGDPAYCGEVAGMVISPIAFDLAGSTHEMTEVRSLSELPTDFLSSCP